MEITNIEYPEGFQLEGWRKKMLENYIAAIFGSFFDVCYLDKCRAQILGKEPDQALNEELSGFHCVPFEYMTVEEAQTLIDKAAAYIGIKLTVQHTEPSEDTEPFLDMESPEHTEPIQHAKYSNAKIVLSMLAVIAIVVGMLVNMPRHEVKGPHEEGSSIASLSLPPLNNMPEALPDPIFTATVRSNHPAAAAAALAGAVKDESGEYNVTVTVTPTHPMPALMLPTIQPQEKTQNADPK